jgi:hypothetical protein
MNFTALVRNHFPSDVNVQWNATRLLLASMHIQYYTLNESDGGAGISNDEWKKIKGRNLLKKSEIGLLMAYTGYSIDAVARTHDERRGADRLLRSSARVGQSPSCHSYGRSRR